MSPYGGFPQGLRGIIEIQRRGLVESFGFHDGPGTTILIMGEPKNEVGGGGGRE